ncbi:MAG: hypothetical protein XE11_1094 [Methanomicrobiales archaeon 53_19]|nr:MAG: hypothetical protein XE11_1094 [Methanomicrobiales archaeon 53_19]
MGVKDGCLTTSLPGDVREPVAGRGTWHLIPADVSSPAERSPPFR